MVHANWVLESRTCVAYVSSPVYHSHDLETAVLEDVGRKGFQLILTKEQVPVKWRNGGRRVKGREGGREEKREGERDGGH